MNCSTMQPLQPYYQSLKGAEQIQNCKATKRHSEVNIFCAIVGKKQTQTTVGLFIRSTAASEAFHNNITKYHSKQVD